MFPVVQCVLGALEEILNYTTIYITHVDLVDILLHVLDDFGPEVRVVQQHVHELGHCFKIHLVIGGLVLVEGEQHQQPLSCLSLIQSLP